jgi:hypothetical protein
VVASPEEGVVLGIDEQENCDARQRRDTEQRKIPLAFVVLAAISLVTIVIGAVRPGLGMAFAVGFGWLLWRYLPALGDLLVAASDGEHGADLVDPFPEADGRPNPTRAEPTADASHPEDQRLAGLIVPCVGPAPLLAGARACDGEGHVILESPRGHS